MKISVKNLGVLKQAEFELGELTLICGGNNTGKTYATYALFGFLQHWKSFLEVVIPNRTINALLTGDVTRVNVAMKADDILRRGCRKYTQQLSKLFASRPEHFKNTTFQVYLEPETILSIKRRAFEQTIQFADGPSLSLFKAKGEEELVISLLIEGEKRSFTSGWIKGIISDKVIELLFGKLFPQPFIASAERTGAAIFRKELNFARNRLLKEMIQSEENINPRNLLSKSYQDYPLPVEVNVDFIRRLENIAREDSFLVEHHPQILNDFADIIGGEYIAESNDTIYFKPAGKQQKLTMDESSSAVRSLLDIGFYLRHVAKPGDLLMIDEPELNLHPENQCRMARLFARLANLGIRVFVTTHSDYIVKELNTLIMLNQDKPYLKQIAEEEGYQTEELISADKIRVYIAEEALMKLKNRSRRSRHQTLVPARIDPELGIEARSFDETINKMNEIQEAIVWGGDE